MRAAERARQTRPEAWAELAEDVGEDEGDLADVVRGGGWEAPLRIEAEHLVLAALGAVPLIEVEAEGLPLSLVRAAEAVTRAAVAEPAPPPTDDDLAGRRCSSPRPRWPRPGRRCRPAGRRRARLAEELLAQGLEPDEVTAVLPLLPLERGTADRVVAAAPGVAVSRRGRSRAGAQRAR